MLGQQTISKKNMAAATKASSVVFPRSSVYAVSEEKTNGPIDHDTQRRVEEQVNQWQQIDNGLPHAPFGTEQESIKVPSCLPDELPEQLMFGRWQEIQQVIKVIQSELVSIVWITGGPGFGKTTVASKAAHELTRLECRRAVMFCSLRSTKSFHYAATLMTLSCNENQTHLPEKPKHWLLNWSKQQVSKVTFVLDNADEVLEYDDRNDFLNLLEEMKRLSEKKVTFIITSRKAYITVSPQSNVRLAILSVEEAKSVLLSRVPDEENRKKLSKVEKLAEICGFVPLALCIAGSSLSGDYNEDEFIRGLEEEPLEVLQDNRRSTDQTSVQKSINRSFEVLDEVEQKALVLLCVFPGSFSSDAATSLITDCTTSTKSVLVLQELKDRSLVEQLKPGRYQVHQLIQTFVQKIATRKYPNLLDRGKKLACAQFISRFADNTKLYWGKDTCKQAVDFFSADRHNFEYFFAEGVELNKQTFVSNLLQNCMYLEKCVLPNRYVEMLERILSSIDSTSQPIPYVELLCLLGHGYRKSGNKINYQQSMKRAEDIYSKNRQEFKKHPVSEVYYLNSNARFLSENWKYEQLQQEITHSLHVCNHSDKLRFHPEKAAALLYAGVFAKRKHDFEEARQKLEEALDLFNQCLGKHLMTAECMKNIADLNLELHQRNIQLGDTTQEHRAGEEKFELKKSHEYYEKALSMMKELGVDDHKEVVLTLKNFTVCQKRQGNLEEATSLLQKAERVVESELDKEDHMWKAMMKFQWALLYDEKHQKGEEKSEEKAVTLMKEGLEMARRLGKQIHELNSRMEILPFIDRFPGEFPGDKFPRPIKRATGNYYFKNASRNLIYPSANTSLNAKETFTTRYCFVHCLTLLQSK